MMSSSSSDKTKASVTIPTLNSTNYHEWADAIKAFMRFNGVWFLIEGYGTTATNKEAGMARPSPSVDATTRVTTNATATASWDEKNDKALGTILLYTAANIKHVMQDSYTALEAWTKLANEYEKPGAVSAFVAFQKLFVTTLSDQSPLGPQIDGMIQQAAEVSDARIEIKDQFLALLLINCMPKSYQQIASTILATAKDVKTLKPSDVRPMILKEEQRRVANRQQLSKISTAPKHSKWCEKCNKETNHTTEQHWPGGKCPTNQQSAAEGSGSGKQSRDKKDGKKGRGKKGKGKDNATTINTLQILEVPNVPSTSSESITVSLYAQRDQQLTHWMINSGYTSHVTFNKADFVSYHEFPTLGLASTAGKSQTINILGHGTVVIQVEVDHNKRNIVLQNVLYVPDAAERFFAP